jgi:hypothetical protein
MEDMKSDPHRKGDPDDTGRSKTDNPDTPVETSNLGIDPVPGSGVSEK